MREVVAPELKNLQDAAARSSGDFLQISVEHDGFDEPPALSENEDMRRVDFPCHSGEPAKVLDHWSEDVHCLICGQPAP